MVSFMAGLMWISRAASAGAKLPVCRAAVLERVMRSGRAG